MIRQANKFDIPDIIKMLKRYREASPLEWHKDSNDQDHVERILAQVFAGRGVAFVSVDDYEEINGMILAMINPNLWDPTLLAMNEMAYWVNPESRGGTAGYRLLKAYQDYCEDLKARGLIKYYTISKMVTSPNLDYGRFGFNKLEEMWRA